jgi:hypothetical protein
MPDFINAQAVAVVVFLALVNNRLIEYFLVPLFEHYRADKKWLLYVAAVTGFALGMLATADPFAPGMFIHPMVSKVVTALLIGGGANLIHDVMDKKT